MRTQDSTLRPTRILTAASRLIAHYGFNKTTMDDIAREAGLSKGSLYLEWSSKDALFEALLAHEMKQLLLDLRQRIEQDPEGGRIANVYRHTLLAMRANLLICALYVRDSRVLGDFVRRQDVTRYTERLLLGNETIRQMQAAGLVRTDLRPEAIGQVFALMALGFIHLGSILPRQDAAELEEVAETMSQMVQGGLVTGSADSGAGKAGFIQMIDLMLKQVDRAAPDGA